jgi:hypothetical protein
VPFPEFATPLTTIFSDPSSRIMHLTPATYILTDPHRYCSSTRWLWNCFIIKNVFPVTLNLLVLTIHELQSEDSQALTKPNSMLKFFPLKYLLFFTSTFCHLTLEEGRGLPWIIFAYFLTSFLSWYVASRVDSGINTKKGSCYWPSP